MSSGLGIPAPTPEIREHNLSNLEKARQALAAKRAKIKEEAEMTEKKKADNAAGANQPLDGEKAQEIVATYETVSLAIMQLIANKWVSLNDNYVISAKEIFSVQPHLEALGGGGSFKLVARDPENLGNTLTRWTVHINKPPRPPMRSIDPIPPPFMIDPWALPTGPQVAPVPQPTQLPTATTPQDTMQYPPQPPPNLPPQYRGLPVEQQWAYWQSMQQAQAQRTGLDPASQVALSQVNALQAEKGQLMAVLAAKDAELKAATKSTDDKFERLEREFQRERDELKAARAKAEADATEARHRADMEARDARHKADMDARDAANREALAKITARLENGGDNGKKSEAPFWMPLALEWMKSSASKDEAERGRALEQQKLLIASMKREPGIEAEAMKHIVELLKSKADEKVAATESQIMMINTISSFIKEQQGEEPPLWVGIANNFVEMLKGGMMGAAVQQVQMPQGPALEESNEAPGTTTVVKSDEITADDKVALIQWQRFKSINDEAAKATFMAFQSPKMPPEFNTSEWRLLIFNLHFRKMSPEKLAELTVNHMEHLLEFGLMSPQFKPVFEVPREMLEPVILALPIAQLDKEYATAFLDELVDEIQFRVTEKKRVEKEEAEEKAEEQQQAQAAP